MFCCLAASTARALLCMASAEFGIQVNVEAVVRSKCRSCIIKQSSVAQLVC